MKKLLHSVAILLALSFIPCISTVFAESEASLPKKDAEQPAPAANADGRKTDDPELMLVEEKEIPPAPAEKKLPVLFVQDAEETVKPDEKVNYKRSERIQYVVITGKDTTAVYLSNQVVKYGNAVVIFAPDSEEQISKTALLDVKLPNGVTFGIKTADLSRFLAFLRPRSVILLGSDAIIPKLFALAIPPYCQRLNVTDSSWKVNAVKLDNILNTGHRIYTDYQEFFDSELKAVMGNTNEKNTELIPGQEPGAAAAVSSQKTEETPAVETPKKEEVKPAVAAPEQDNKRDLKTNAPEKSDAAINRRKAGPSGPIASEEELEYRESKDDQVPDNIPVMNKN